MDEYINHAKLYDFAVGPFLQSTHKDIIDILLENGSLSVLDLCSGTGLFAGKAEKDGLNVTGVDLSPSMLGVARRKHPLMDFLEQDASSLTAKNGCYDAVTISFALHEKSRIIAFAIIKEALRVLRNGGLLIVADYRYPVERKNFLTGYGIRLVEYIAGKEHYFHYKEYMKYGGSEAFLLEAGLSTTCRNTHMNGWSGVFVHVKQD